MSNTKILEKWRKLSNVKLLILSTIGLWLTVGSVSEDLYELIVRTTHAQSITKSNEQSNVDFLKSLLGGEQTQDTFLTVEEAYQLEVVALDSGLLQAIFTIADGYYLYRDKIKISSLSTNIQIGEVLLPDGKLKSDAYFGEQQVYYRQLIIEIPFAVISDSQKSDFDVTVNYQGCAEQGICYPPIKKTFSISLPDISDANTTVTSGGQNSTSDSNLTSDPTLEQNYLWPILLAFIAGIALTFTPCVLPLIPILTSIVIGQKGSVSQMRAGLLSICYVLGTAVTYTAVGIFAGITGSQLQAYFQNPWGIGVVVIILITLSFSMFGLFQIQMPVSIQATLQSRLSRIKGGVVGGVFLMGIISALIVGACVSPVLMAVLGVAIERGDPVLGGAIMFSLAIGSGVVLIAIGFGAAFFLPKSGPWMDTIKHAFGVMLLGVAIYILSALPAVPVLYLWSMLFIVSAVYLGALRTLPNEQNGWPVLWKGVGVFILIWGILALIGAMSGARDILRPINFANLNSYTQGSNPTLSNHESEQTLFTRVSSLAALDQKLNMAKNTGRPVMLDYYADWCVDCVRMENNTFSDQRVRQKLGNFVMLQVDVTDPQDKQTNDIKKRYGVYGPPAMLFFNAKGEEISALRRYGYMNPDEFLDHVSKL